MKSQGCSNLADTDILPLAKHILASIGGDAEAENVGGKNVKVEFETTRDPDLSEAFALMDFQKQKSQSEMNTETSRALVELAETKKSLSTLPSSLEELTKQQKSDEERKLTTKIYHDVLSKKRVSQKKLVSSLFDLSHYLPMVVTILRWVADFLRVFVCSIIIYTSKLTNASKITLMLNTLTETFMVSTFISYITSVKRFLMKTGLMSSAESFLNAMTKVLSRIRDYFSSSPYIQSFLNFVTVLFSLNVTTLMTTAGFILILSIIAPTLYVRSIPESLRKTIEKKYETLLTILKKVLYLPVKAIFTFFNLNSKLQSYILSAQTVYGSLTTIMGFGSVTPVAYALAVASLSSTILGFVCSEENKKCKTVQFILSIPGLYMFWTRILQNISESFEAYKYLKNPTGIESAPKTSTGSYLCGNDSTLFDQSRFQNICERTVEDWDGNIIVVGELPHYKSICRESLRGFMLYSSIPQLNTSMESLEKLSPSEMERLLQKYMEGGKDSVLQKYILDYYRVDIRTYNQLTKLRERPDRTITFFKDFVEKELELRWKHHEVGLQWDKDYMWNYYKETGKMPYGTDEIRDDIVKGHMYRMFAAYYDYDIVSKDIRNREQVENVQFIRSDMPVRTNYQMEKYSFNKLGKWYTNDNKDRQSRSENEFYLTDDNYVLEGTMPWLRMMQYNFHQFTANVFVPRGTNVDESHKASASNIVGKLARFGVEFPGLISYHQRPLGFENRNKYEDRGEDISGALEFIMGQPVKYDPAQVALNTYMIPKAPRRTRQRTKSRSTNKKSD